MSIGCRELESYRQLASVPAKLLEQRRIPYSQTSGSRTSIMTSRWAMEAVCLCYTLH